MTATKKIKTANKQRLSTQKKIPARSSSTLISQLSDLIEQAKNPVTFVRNATKFSTWQKAYGTVVKSARKTAESVVERVGLSEHIDLDSISKNVAHIERQLRSLTTWRTK